jgi:uncharacterized RDD family membrane protein YckC
MATEEDRSYVGFWVRLVAEIVDTLLLMLVVVPLLVMIYGWEYFSQNTRLISGPADVLISWVFPIVATLVFWMTKQATPGKMAFSARIVDARSGSAPSAGQFVVRYLGYFLSLIPLGLGFIWIAFDKRKQGWHDKLAGTLVVRHTGRMAA